MENNTQISKNPSCWVITEGIAGTENQCLGICDALGITPEVKRIKLRQPWRSLSPGFRLFSKYALSRKGDQIKAKTPDDFPDLVIASGRKSVLTARYIRRASQGKTFVVMVQDPGIDPKYFDLVIVPYHDSLRGANVHVTEGAPNRVSADVLKKDHHIYQDIIKRLPPPLVAVLIGGNSKRHKITETDALRIADQLKTMQKIFRAGLMVTISRRTPPKIAKIIQRAVDNPDTLFWNGKSENPYFSFLSHADAIIVTEDSISMLSEAATTGKPVYRLPISGTPGRFQKFYDYMEERHTIRKFDGGLEQWTYIPLSDAQNVADIIKKELENRRNTAHKA